MSLLRITGQLLKAQNGLCKIRYSMVERPALRKARSWSTVGNKYQAEAQDEEIGAIGWLLLAMPIGAFMLGTWQVKRRKWKLELIQHLHERVTSPPVPLPEDLMALEDMEYRPVKVKGHFLYDKEFKIGPKSLIKDGAGASESTSGLLSSHGNTGHWIITPFKLEDRDLTILVNRGWVRARREKIPKEELGHVPGVIEVTGVVRLNEKRPPLMPKNSPKVGMWVYRDVNAMAELAGTAPVFIDMVSSDKMTESPIPGQTRITLRNEHTSYIITWYTLSLLTALMWHRLYIKKLPLL